MSDFIFPIYLKNNDMFNKIVHEHRLREHLTESELSGLVNTLLDIIRQKDEYTYIHSKNVADYTLRAIKTRGFDSGKQAQIYAAAFLHDIGKIGIPDAVLKKKGRLTKEEQSIVRQHPVIGHRIVMRFPALESIAGFVRSHHEKYDGSGYPDRLSGDDIPEGAAIIAVADAYDAITTRDFNIKKNKADAIKEMKKYCGSQFNTEIANEFINIL